MPTYSVFLETYEAYRKDWTLSGGVFIAVKNDLTALEECLLMVEDVRLFGHHCNLRSQKSSMYQASTIPLHPIPNILDFLDGSLGNIFSQAAKFPLIVLCGDFNCGAINWPELCLHKNLWHNVCDSHLLEIATNYGLTQFVNGQTRAASGWLLDLVFSSYPNTVQVCHTIPGIPGVMTQCSTEWFLWHH